MKVKSTILSLAVMGVMATGCQNSDEQYSATDFPQDRVIRITTDGSATRAGNSTDNLADLSLTVTNDASTSYSYSNEKMTKSESAWTGPLMLWQNATTPVAVLAYAPYQDTSVFSVLANQSTEADVAASDFVGCYRANFLPVTVAGDDNDVTWKDGKISLKLNHLMFKLKVVVSVGEGFNTEGVGPTDNPITSLTVEGSKLKGTLSTADGTIKMVPVATDNDPASIATCCITYTAATTDTKTGTATYECILLPQTIAAGNFKVIITTVRGTYQWTSNGDTNGDIVFLAGQERTITTTVN